MWLATSTAGRGNLDCGAGKVTGQPPGRDEFNNFCGKNKIALILDAVICLGPLRGSLHDVLKSSVKSRDTGAAQARGSASA
jgi:hypothetical protein